MADASTSNKKGLHVYVLRGRRDPVLMNDNYSVPDSPRTYIAIDLKSFYASAECAARGFDPLTTNLVVADPSRTEKTICLAVSPSLKAHGISGRARLFEVVQRVKEVNAERLQKAIRLGLVKRSPDDRKYHFSGSSFNAPALAADPSLELTYYVAPPRMKLYEEISTRIVSIYMKYISPDDLIVYSIDECFLDVTAYLNTYHMTAHELAITMIREVLSETGITAAAGIGTNRSRYSDEPYQTSLTSLPYRRIRNSISLRVAALQSIMKPYFTPHLYLYLYIYKYKIFL